MRIRQLKAVDVILGVVSSIFAILTIASSISQLYSVIVYISGDIDLIPVVIFIILLSIEFGIGALLIAECVCFFQGERKQSALLNFTVGIVSIVSIPLSIALFGIGWYLIEIFVLVIVVMIVSLILDPEVISAVNAERKIKKENRLEKRRLRNERMVEQEADLAPNRFAHLNVFYLFWIFTFCSILGLILETIYHAVVFGGYQDRAGLLFGPFSPIYGFGGVLMTVALNRMKGKNILIIFLISAAIGGGFEYLTSWFLEFSFGIVAWDYTGTFLSIDGRTNGFFMTAWGILGIVWVKLFFPMLLWIIKKIPISWRYSVTTICMILMIVDGIMTFQAIDCWYKREAGYEPVSKIELFYAEYFDNEYMENRFQSMTLNPENATRLVP